MPRPRRDTRERILMLLKRKGPLSAALLARQLRITGAGTRQHLARLEAEGLVAARVERRPRGRPVGIWTATDLASARFADGHASLSVALLEAVARRWGRRSLTTLLRPLAEAQVARARARHVEARTPAAKIAALVQQRQREGYLTEARETRGGATELVECHCVVGAAARAYPDICAAELHALRVWLGEDVEVERVSHAASVDAPCVYRIGPKRAPRSPKRRPLTGSRRRG